MSRPEPAYYKNANRDLDVRNLEFADRTVQATAAITPQEMLAIRCPVGGTLGANIIHPCSIALVSRSIGQNKNPTTDSLEAAPFFLRRGQVVQGLGHKVRTASAGDNIRVGLYSNVDDETNWYPNELLADTGNISVGVQGWVSAAINYTVLKTGLYWGAFNSNNNVVVLLGIQDEGFPYAFGADETLGTAFRGVIKVASAFGAMPDPFPGGAVITFESATILVPFFTLSRT